MNRYDIPIRGRLRRRTSLLLGQIIGLVIAFAVSNGQAATLDSPRRDEQFPTDSGRLIVPLPYSMPGIGSGFFMLASFSNMYDSTADGAIVWAFGAARGRVIRFDEVPLVTDHLLLQINDFDINKAAVNEYSSRGMATSASDYNIVEINSYQQRSAQLTASFYQRRLEFTANYSAEDSAAIAFREADGTLITRLSQPLETTHISRGLGALIDLTDDYLDPRDGFRLRLNVNDSPPSDEDQPDFFTTDLSLLYYLPVNHVDTIAFNYYRSDAHMRSSGLLDPAAIRTNIGANCDPLDTACLDAESQRVANTLAYNRYGSANSLGGTDRLRSFPQGRFVGGHSEFVGIEFRTNFIQEATPFDYYIWRDITTSVQLALYAEAGTVAETRAQLWDDYRISYGIGARLLAASGSVYRADFSTGDEGTEIAVFFFYPWH